MSLQNKNYKIIYADPPWQYGNYSNVDVSFVKRLRDGSKFRITPYNALSTRELKQIPISTIADKDSVLLMWTTFPCIEQAFEVIKAWGFTYKTVAFTWVKKNKNGIGWYFGLGNYTRANAEVCLLAKKGKGCKVLRKDIPQICDSPITTHSKKPNVIRDRIVKLFGDVPRIELFARTKIHGWDVFGDDPKLINKPLEVFI